MKKLLTIFSLTALLALGINLESKAQSYKNAIGGRFGAANGVTFKTTLGGNKMLDIIANIRDNKNYQWFRVTGLYEIYNPIHNAPGLNWYYGIGGTLGSVKYKPADESDLYLSVDGVLGLDYKFSGAPINLSLDWKPAIKLAPSFGDTFDASGVGLSLRFTF